MGSEGVPYSIHNFCNAFSELRDRQNNPLEQIDSSVSYQLGFENLCNNVKILLTAYVIVTAGEWRVGLRFASNATHLLFALPQPISKSS